MDRKVATVLGAGLASIVAFLVYNSQDDEPKLKKSSYKMKGVRNKKKTKHLMANENGDEISSVTEDESEDEEEDEDEEEEEDEEEDEEDDNEDDDEEEDEEEEDENPPTKKRGAKKK